MMRFRFLFQNLSRSFSVFSPKHDLEKAMIDNKFSNAKNLESFLNDIDITRTSLSMLAYTLKIAQDNLYNDNLERKKKLFLIRDEVVNNFSKLGPQGIINFSEFIASGHEHLSLEKKKIIFSHIDELIYSHSFDRNQIITLFKNFSPHGFFMMKLWNEVSKIIYSSVTLTLEEISKIMIGSGKLIFDLQIGFFLPCLERIIQLSRKEELNQKYLLKILDALTIKTGKNIGQHLDEFLKILEEIIPKIGENDLILIFKFYNNHNTVDKGAYFCALHRIDKLLSDNQNIKLEHAFELVSLLKEKTRIAKDTENIISKCLKIIKEKLVNEPLSEENLMKMLDFMKPCIDIQAAILLKNQISKMPLITRIKIFQKASWVSVNEEGKLFPLTDIIPLALDYEILWKYYKTEKVDILSSIVNVRNYEYHNLKKAEEFIIKSLKLGLRRETIDELCMRIEDKEYNSKLIKALEPLQEKIYMSLQDEIRNDKNLKISMQFYESNPEVWKDFVTKNKNNFSRQSIEKAIKHYKGPFEAIIYLLKLFKNKIPQDWISLVMKRATETLDYEVLNDFVRILNAMDPHYLLNNVEIYTKFDCFNYFYEHSDHRLITDLFAGACKLIKDLPIDSIYSNYNIKILSFASLLGVLDSEIADIVANNYGYIKKFDVISLLMISSKCSDSKLRESTVKRIFNENLDFKLLRTAVLRYWEHPETKEIDNYVFNVVKQLILSQKYMFIHNLSIMLDNLSELDRNDHLELFNNICALLKNLILSRIRGLRFLELVDILCLADKNLLSDLDFGYVLSKSLIMNKYCNSERSREKLIEKIKNVGLSYKDIVLAVCDKEDDFSSAYLAGTISCLADFRYENETWAYKMANRLFDFVENEKFIFGNDIDYINWIYGLVIFKADKSIIIKHLENSKYFDCEVPTLKHFLLANHIQMDPDLKNVNAMEQKVQKYWREFDYFKHFGIDKPLINRIESSCNEANLEVKTNEFIDKIWVPFYIPANDIVLWPATNKVFLYRSNIFRGEFNMHQNQILGKGKNLHILNKEIINDIGKSNIKEYLKI